MDPGQTELEALRELVRQLIVRVNRLEQSAGVPAGPAAVAPGPPVTVSESEPRAPVPPPVEAALAPPTQIPVQREQRKYRFPTPSISVGQTDTRSLESRIGSRWLNRIGIVAMLVGVSYFL